MNNPANDSLGLFHIHLGMSLVFTESDQILYALDGSPGPRLVVCGHQTGSWVLIRNDIGVDTAAEIRRLVNEEPILNTVGSEPAQLERYLEMLTREAQVQRYNTGALLYSFPSDFTYQHNLSLITSDSDTGKAFLADLPPGFRVQGYNSPVADIRAPWCIALHDGQIASIVETVNIGPLGAETGVNTVPSFRGRGFAAAATAGWASLPSLRPRFLFYGTDRWNRSSRRVTDRLGLQFIGSSFSIT